jgi:hypothetical protein
VTADEEPVADEAIAADAPVEAEDAASEATAEASAPTTAKKAKKPREKLSVAEWQARYQQVVGRPTGSSNVAYMAWKIAEAKAGRVRVGPIERGSGQAVGDKVVLPLGMGRETVAKLDAAVKAFDYRSRMAFIRAALVAFLRKNGGEIALDAAAAIEAEVG